MGAEATENLLKGRISYRSQRQLSSTPTEKYLRKCFRKKKPHTLDYRSTRSSNVEY